MAKPLQSAAARLWPKRDKHDCGVAALASYLRRDYEEILVAADRVQPAFWREGLREVEYIRICKRIGMPSAWTRTFDPDTDDGVLWVTYHDAIRHHVMLLMDGKVYDPDTNPVSVWDFDDYIRHFAAEPVMLLKEIG